MSIKYLTAAAMILSSSVVTAQTISCGDISFDVPPKMGDVPSIELAYPSTVQMFSFRDDNLLVVAMDSDDSSRLRLVISAQKNASNGNYEGQIVTDSGGNQMQMDNSTVTCTVSDSKK